MGTVHGGGFFAAGGFPDSGFMACQHASLLRGENDARKSNRARNHIRKIEANFFFLLYICIYIYIYFSFYIINVSAKRLLH